MRWHLVNALLVSHGERRCVINQPSQPDGWRFLTGLILFLLSFVLAPLASAQDSAAIVGTVTDPSGAVVAGASVTVINVDIGMVRAVVTDNAGRYRVFSRDAPPIDPRCCRRRRSNPRLRRPAFRRPQETDPDWVSRLQLNP